MDNGLPHNLEAERGLIGSVFWSYGALQKACEEVSKEVFYLDSNARIFDVIQELYNDKKQVSIYKVVAELVIKNLINQFGGV